MGFIDCRGCVFDTETEDGNYRINDGCHHCRRFHMDMYRKEED